MASNVIETDISGISYQEYKRATRSLERKLYIITIIFAELATVLCFVMGVKFAWLALIIPAVCVAAAFLIFSSMNRKRYKRQRIDQYRLSYVFNDKGFTVSDGKSRNSVKWKAIHHLEIDDKHLLIFPNRRSVNVVPRRFMKQGDCDRIAAMYNKAIK